jgi:BirA family biotin operon repressor/biotin-[acetyl-CoA-carboxylase] ligase
MTIDLPISGELQSLLQRVYGLDASIDRSEIQRYGAFVGSVVESHPVLPRAMDYAREQISAAARENRSMPSGMVILADTMTGSKGRFTRSWYSPPGGLWGCMIHAETLLPQARAFIPMAVGVACCEAIISLGLDRQATLRWVNDVLIDGRKVAGFLVETYLERTHNEEFTLVGFGINVNNTTFPEEIRDSAGSLSQVAGKELDLRAFSIRFLAHLAWNFGLLYHEEQSWLREGQWSGVSGMHRVLERWLSLSDSVGRDVVYGFDVMTAPQYEGQVIGVDEYGGLQLRLADGYIKTEYSGEIRYRS